MNTDASDKRVHLVLGPGGVRTVAYLGAIQQLESEGYSFASISGCSAGSFVAALICAGQKASDLERKFIEMDLSRFAGRKKFGFPIRALFSPFANYVSSGLPQALCELLGSDPLLKNLKIPFATTGMDLVTNTFVIFSSQHDGEKKLSEVIAIATAVPFVYSPHDAADGKLLVDAAVATACPVWLAEVHETQLPIMALTCSGDHSLETPRNFGEYLSRIIDASVASGDAMLLSFLPRLRRVNIQCGSIAAFEFGIERKSKRWLIERGRSAVAEARLNFRDERLDFAPTSPAANAAGDPTSPNQLVSTIINNFFQREIHMSTNQISVGGNAIINIDSTLNNVQQSLQQSAGLAAEKRNELESLVAEFRKEIDKIKESHAQEAALITQRLQEVVQGATQPAEKRNSSLLKLSSKGLVEAAETVGEIMPKLLATAGLIAKFVVGL